MRHHRALILALVVGLAATLPAAGQDGTETKPTVVDAVETTANGTAISVAATVDWGGTDRVVLGTDPAGDAPPANNATAPHGLDLRAVSAWIPDGNVPVATFAWHLETFDRPPPPEVVRYYMTFQLNGQAFALQAKTSDFVSGANLTADPATLAARLASYAEHIAEHGTIPQFRLRGNCETVGIVNNCGHVAWVTGAFDTANNEIRINVPLDHPAMPGLRPSATLQSDQGAWASLQPVLDAAQTRDTLAATEPYTIPTRSATATVRDGSGAVVAGPFGLQVASDGAVTGTVNVPGLAPGSYTLRVQACIGGTCGTGDAPVSL